MADDAASPPAAAPPAAKKSALDQLRQDFITRIGGDLNSADLYLRGAGKVELAEHASGTILPDDEPLLLHAIVGENHVSAGQDIYSMMHAKRLMISLGDFCTAASFAIKTDPEKGVASGWFIRQENTFSLDAKKNEVTIRGKTMGIDPGDIDMTGSDLLVSSDALERWLGLDFTYDFASLLIYVRSAQKLPVEEAYERSQKGAAHNYGEGPPKLPYRYQDYGLLSEPYIDANITGNWFRSPNTPVQKSGSWSTIMSGDLLGFNAQGFATGGLQKPYFQSLRGSLGKQDPNGNLLGPLHATSYSLGDVDAVSSTLIGGGALEQGITATNHPVTANNTSATSTPVRGDAQPGWDVELYRNGSYIDIRHVGANGQYDFGNVDLLGGDNDFKLVFYGPQGEVREVHQHIGVNPQAVGQNKGYYALSLTRTGDTTFEKISGGSANVLGKGDPHFGATYEYGLGKLGTADFGLRTQSLGDGSYTTFEQIGLATYFLGTYLNSDVAYESGNGATAEVLTARRNFGTQATLLQYTHNSPEYSVTPNIPGVTTGTASSLFSGGSTVGSGSSTPASPLPGSVIKDVYRANLSGPLANKLYLFSHPNYNLGATYTDFYSSGATQTNITSSLTTGIKGIGLSGGLNYSRTADDQNVVTNAESGTFSARGPLLGGTWRFQSQYELKPVRQLLEHELEYDHSIMPNLDSTTTLTYQPQPPEGALETMAVSLNWQTSKATISPNFSLDNRHDIAAGVNVHFGAGADPYSHIYNVYNSYMSTAGGVAARIFLDKNGDGIYDDGDELMPDVEIKAMQVHREALSDAKGIAFIPDLPQNQLTDVAVDQATFKDSYDISLFKGVSIRPHPGGVTRLEFPVVVSGSMDGQAQYADVKKGPQPARDLTVSLIAPDGEEEKAAAAAYDGYWSIDGIRPGVYWLTAKTDESMSPGYMTPRRVEFTAGGTTAFGQAVTLTPGYNIKFSFRSENAPPDGEAHTRVVTPGDIERQKTYIEFGRYHSRLALAVAWYKFRMRGGADSFDLVTPVAKVKPDAKTGEMTLLLKPKKDLTVEAAAQTCQSIEDMKFDCGVEVITRYRTLTLLAANGRGSVSGTVSLPAQKLPGFHLDLYDSNGWLAQSAVSAADGRYAFPSVPAGHYLLMADAKDAYDRHLLRAAPDFIDIGYGSGVITGRDIALIPAAGTSAKDVPVTVQANLGDFAAVNPSLDKSIVKDKVVVLNLGSYNSRQLMAVVWYKLRKKYPDAVAAAHLLVQPADSFVSPRSGKNVLRAALPGYDVKDAWNRCRILTAAGETCAVEVLPKGLPELSAAAEPTPKG